MCREYRRPSRRPWISFATRPGGRPRAGCSRVHRRVPRHGADRWHGSSDHHGIRRGRSRICRRVGAGPGRRHRMWKAGPAVSRMLSLLMPGGCLLLEPACHVGIGSARRFAADFATRLQRLRPNPMLTSGSGLHRALSLDRPRRSLSCQAPSRRPPDGQMLLHHRTWEPDSTEHGICWARPDPRVPAVARWCRRVRPCAVLLRSHAGCHRPQCIPSASPASSCYRDAESTQKP
jgi:hypothetical protein